MNNNDYKDNNENLNSENTVDNKSSQNSGHRRSNVQHTGSNTANNNSRHNVREGSNNNSEHHSSNSSEGHHSHHSSGEHHSHSGKKRLTKQQKKKRTITIVSIVAAVVVIIGIMGVKGLSDAKGMLKNANELKTEMNDMLGAAKAQDAEAANTAVLKLDNTTYKISKTLSSPLWKMASHIPVAGKYVKSVDTLIGLVEDASDDIIKPAVATISASFWCNFAFSTLCSILRMVNILLSISEISTDVVPTRTGRPACTNCSISSMTALYFSRFVL